MHQLDVTKVVIMRELGPFWRVSSEPDIEIFGFFYESLNALPNPNSQRSVLQGLATNRFHYLEFKMQFLATADR
jgi:hypothetical protein